MDSEHLETAPLTAILGGFRRGLACGTGRELNKKRLKAEATIHLRVCLANKTHSSILRSKKTVELLFIDSCDSCDLIVIGSISKLPSLMVVVWFFGFLLEPSKN